MSNLARLLFSAPLQRSGGSLVVSSATRGVNDKLKRVWTRSLVSYCTDSTHSGSRWAHLLKPGLIRCRSFQSGQRLGSRICRTQLRSLWTRALRRSRELDTESNDAPALEKGEPIRLSFYSTSSGEFTYAGSLDELTTQESAFQSMLIGAQKGSQSHAGDETSYWLDVLKATPQEIIDLCTKLGVHSLTIEDILSGETNEKLEMHPKYRFISYRSFDADEKSASYLATVNVYILSFSHATLSLRSDHFPNISRVPKRLNERFEHVKTRCTDWILFEIVDAITDGFAHALKPARFKIEELSESIMEGGQDPAVSLRSIASIRRKVLALRRLMGNKSEILKSLVKRFSMETKSEISLHFSDIEDHLNAVTQDLNHWEETLSQSENNCLIQLNLQTSRAQNESSEAISKLTILSTVLLPLNVITGLWGMNVTVPGQHVESLFWFGSLASVMTIVASSGYLLASRFMRNHRRPPSHFK